MSGNIVVPIVDPNRGWSTWNVNQIYTGEGTGNVVPNRDDLVISYIDGWLRVISVDYTTGHSTLAPAGALSQADSPVEPTYENVLISGGPSTITEAFRMYIDGSVTPHTMALDATIKAYGSTTRYMKVFKGTDIENGIVISRVYNEINELVGENIPLESIDSNNPAQKRPMVGYSSENLKDGEVVTIVFYNDNDSAVHRSRLLVKNTKWVRSASASSLRISNIELKSPFLSASDDRLLELPINIPVQSIDMMGVVNYVNGEQKILPIDGSKFNVFGLRNFVSTILGQKQPVSLIYYLSPNEVADGVADSDIPAITASYMAETTRVDNAYTVKLYTYPVWIDAINGYRLVHFLYNLERNISMDVTPYVQIAMDTQPFKPTLYGNTQSLRLTLDLSKVSPSFKKYTHIQNTKVTLLRHGNEQLTKWTVGYDSVLPDYGNNINATVEFINSNLWKMKINNGFGSLTHWLRETYEKVIPLFDSTSEISAPVPNLIRIKVGTYEMEFGLSIWDQEITINSLITAGDIVTIEFIYRSQVEDLDLAIIGMPVRMLALT